jgi:hypothetical protein
VCSDFPLPQKSYPHNESGGSLDKKAQKKLDCDAENVNKMLKSVN